MRSATIPDNAESIRKVAGKRRPSLVGEFWDFLKQNKKWWLLPIILIFLAMGVLVLLSGSAAAPFIYTLF